MTTIKKVGFTIPITMEALLGYTPPKGRFEPVGNKTAQFISYLGVKSLFKVYRFLERSLERSRHFVGVSGWDYEEAYLKDFEQRKRWISDDSPAD